MFSRRHRTDPSFFCTYQIGPALLQPFFFLHRKLRVLAVTADTKVSTQPHLVRLVDVKEGSFLPCLLELY